MGHSEEELYERHVFHRTDHRRNRRKLGALYGRVAAAQDALIEQHILGQRVLDVGAGYGNFARRLLDRGYTVTAIDPHQESRELARSWYDVDVQDGTIYSTPFADHSFDTVVLREVGEHLDFDEALREIVRLATQAVILFQTNVTPLVRLMRRVARHHEYRSPPVAYYIVALSRAGLRVDVVRYSDLLAFPLSGGFVTPQLFPPLRGLYSPLVEADRRLAEVLQPTGLPKLLGWRVLIRAIAR